MKERPIIFYGPMVEAILDGRKTQTRRIVKPQPGDGMINVLRYNRSDWPCPYGQPGDRLWVRETWGINPNDYYGCDEKDRKNFVHYRADSSFEPRWKWRPSIHMPRWASRLTLEITGVRVERLQKMVELDLISEGFQDHFDGKTFYPAGYFFKETWNSLNSKRGYGWDTNPWVWIVEFKRINR